MLPEEQFRGTTRITPEQAESLFASPKEFRVAFSRRKGPEMATLWNGVKLFTGLEFDERKGDHRIWWLQGFGPTPGLRVRQALEALNADKNDLVVKSSYAERR